MSEDSNSNSQGCSCGCGGCVMFIVFILLFWAICFGLPINDKVWNIDIFPPRIWDMNHKPKTQIIKEDIKDTKNEKDEFKQSGNFSN